MEQPNDTTLPSSKTPSETPCCTLKEAYQVRNKGDMIGDKPLVEERHLRMIENVFPLVQDKLAKSEKFVVTVGGPSGSGKSELGALIADYAQDAGKSVYVISCDNYPFKAPRDNEQYRQTLYETEGEEALRSYLGTQNETDFDRLAQIAQDFKAGASEISLRIIDNPGNVIADERKKLDCSSIDLLVIEGTWSPKIKNIDLSVGIFARPEDTLEHRQKRGRDPLDEFGEVVLAIEQNKIYEMYKNCDILVCKDGTVLEERPDC